MDIKLYRAKDLQELLGLGWKQAEALMRTEGFPTIKIGRERMVLEDKLYEWLMSCPDVKLNYDKL